MKDEWQAVPMLHGAPDSLILHDPREEFYCIQTIPSHLIAEDFWSNSLSKACFRVASGECLVIHQLAPLHPNTEGAG
jgi:hypothetical protein